MDQELERRRALTFKQAEGLEPLPRQLERNEISRQLRARIYNAIHRLYNDSTDHRGYVYRESALYHFLVYKHFHLNSGYASDFDAEDIWRYISVSLREDDYPDFYETVQEICRSDHLPSSLNEEISDALEYSMSPYRLVEGTLIPFGSEFEANTFTRAVESVSGEFAVRAHLRGAANALSDGRWASSVRDSIHAVESIARQITGADSLGSALNQLGKAGHVHAAMNEAFKRLYGYTSDESGIRHALLDDGDAKVTEADAMFMLGACAAFVTYLSVNARKAGLLSR